jgi:hypothetical protein
VSLLYRGVSLQHCFANFDLGERPSYILTSDKNGHGHMFMKHNAIMVLWVQNLAALLYLGFTAQRQYDAFAYSVSQNTIVASRHHLEPEKLQE